MAIMSVKVCDTCRDVTREAGRWTVQAPDGARVTVDLCDEHDSPLRAFMDLHRKAVKKGVKRRGAAHHKNRKITTMDEIEAAKKGA